MTPNLGLSTTNLDLSPDPAGADLIEHLNHTIKPNKRLAADDIHIRALLVCSTAVNAYGGRFAEDDLPQIGDFLVDSPVLVGHRKDTLPIARIFYTDIVARDNAPWVRAWCYWLKSADSSATLRDNIDGGVYKECSLSFTYQLPECSICGKDIRLCHHEPFVEYSTPSGRETCHFIYRRIDRVLETSLVYRGAVADTKIENIPLATAISPTKLANRLELTELDTLSDSCKYLITPAYDGIPVTLSFASDRLIFRSLSDDSLPDTLGNQFTSGGLANLNDNFGLLVGYENRTRCNLAQLRSFLLDSSRPVNRLVVHLFPHPAIHLPLLPAYSSSHSICPISYRIAGAKEIRHFAGQLKSKLGVDLWPLGLLPPAHPGWRYNPSRIKLAPPPRYMLITTPGRSSAHLTIDADKFNRSFTVHQFDLKALLRGARLIADIASPHHSTILNDDPNSSTPPPSRFSGDILTSLTRGDGLTFTASAPLRGSFILRPVLLAGKTRYLFYRRRE